MTEYVWQGRSALRRTTGREEDGRQPIIETIEPGEAFDPTDKELESFGDLIESHDAPSDSTGADAAVSASDAPFDPTDLSVREIRERLTDADYTDGELGALAAAERGGEARSTALDAIEA